MKTLFFLVFNLFIFSNIYCQDKAILTFNSIIHDFGNIKEENGKVNYTFEFTNTGKIPLIISNVKTSCGCTTPEWTSSPVIPGLKGSIDVEFNPYKRPGIFNKTISVYSNATIPVITLTIKGNVIPKEQKAEEIYKYSIGELRITNPHVSFGVIKKGEVKLKTIETANLTDHPIQFELQDVPKHIKSTSSPSELKPGQTGEITFEFNSNAVNDWDYIINRINVLVNKKENSNNRIIITAMVQEDFATLTSEDLASSPKAQFNSNTFDFGTITQDQQVEYDFLLTNTGQKDLLIRKVRASCGCTAVSPTKNIIKPGESTSIKAVFNPAGKSGNQKKSITVITNDPKNFKTILWVKGIVEEAQKK
ncbi:MAG: DUF1573 domain-containing protein [Bacteroidales bacterium]|nr:DUF1573 domain-containing protein [Bacteroidales bacterium]